MPSTVESNAQGSWPVRVLATLGGNLYLVLGSLLMATLVLFASLIPPRGVLVSKAVRLWGRGLLIFSGVRISVIRASVPGQYVFMCNHESLFDIPALIVALDGEVRFLAKRTLFMLPIFGWALQQGGFISVDRRDRSTAQNSFTSAVSKLKGGDSIMIFPEGARTLDGELQDFEKGGFLLALKSGLPIVPVGIRGAFEIRRRGSFAIRPGKLEVRFGEPIEIEGYEVKQRAELQQRVRREIADLAGQSF